MYLKSAINGKKLLNFRSESHNEMMNPNKSYNKELSMTLNANINIINDLNVSGYRPSDSAIFNKPPEVS